MKPVDQNIREELSMLTSEKEASELAHVAELLMQTPKFTRKPQPHDSSWKLLASRIKESRHSRLYRWRYAFAAVPAVFVLLIGLIGFSAHALPGDMTYSVKRYAESAQATLALSPAKRAEACSVFMKRRANELAHLNGARLTIDTVTSLNAAIIEEAQEFSEYADQAGNDRIDLQQQRVRDAKYVIEALNTTLEHTNDKAQEAVIKKTKAAMQDIVNG